MNAEERNRKGGHSRWAGTTPDERKREMERIRAPRVERIRAAKAKEEAETLAAIDADESIAPWFDEARHRFPELSLKQALRRAGAMKRRWEYERRIARRGRA